MGKTTGIEWTNHTHNFWFGCKKISQGCAKCYAERDMTKYGRDFKIVTRAKGFDKPLSWKEPAMVFTCSWSDFFIEEADPWRAEAWDIIRRTPHLTYQILTKRPENILARLPTDWGNGWPNVWLGVSCENQSNADKRIPLLQAIPTRIRFLSCEPLLNFIDISSACKPDDYAWEEVNFDDIDDDSEPEEFIEECEAELDWVNYGNDLVVNPEWREWMDSSTDRAKWKTFKQNISWVIVGGESGPNARPMQLDWLRSIVEQCRDAEVPVFVKQDSGPRPGMQGRIPDELWIKEFPE